MATFDFIDYNISMSKISTESYKGVRDFYPEEKFIQKHLFAAMRKTVESFGYVEYDASVLEPAELYRAKSGEEIVNEQTYTFTDRGDREVTLRPEMTPTVARMVASRQHDLTFPLRWYSIPNLFRYEKPQRGRLREHWQLNVDMFGASGISADIELITVGYTLMKNLGATDTDFIIKVNSRTLMTDLFALFSLDDDQSHKTSKLLDRKNKISESDFQTALNDIMGDNWKDFERLITSQERLMEKLEHTDSAKEIITLLESLIRQGIKNVEFDPTIMRGFDYYTGIVFEFFDTSPENNRSLFGGGRYDDLLDMFGARKMPTVGFGMGDVTAQDFLQTHNLLPAYQSSTDLFICLLASEYEAHADDLAKTLRTKGLNVAVNYSYKKIGDQIKVADKQKVPYIIAIGENEATSNTYTLKKLDTGEETRGDVDTIVSTIEAKK